MRLIKANSSSFGWINVNKYRLDWNKKSRSIFQTQVKNFLKPYWRNHVVCEEVPVIGSKMTVDIINFTLNIAIEVQGDQHQSFNPHFHNNQETNFLKQMKHDIVKLNWMEKNKFIFVEIYPQDMPLTEEFFKLKYDIEL